MQTPNKKRKIQESPRIDEDDDWGNEFTAEEFDFLQSQVVEEVVIVPPHPVTHTAEQDCNQTLEERHVLEGQICMLRQSLRQKTEELEKFRQQQSHLASAHLKEQQEIERKHLSNIDQLKSALKFKEHELNSEQEKVRSLENKLKALAVSTSNPKVLSSPLKIERKIPHGSFTNVRRTVTSETQTDSTKGTSSSSLVVNPLFNNIKMYVFKVETPDKLCSSYPCKFYCKNLENKEKDFMESIDRTFKLHISANNSVSSVPMVCCSEKSEPPFTGLAKEIQALRSFEDQLEQCKTNLKYAEQEDSLSPNFGESLKRAKIESLLESMSKLLANLSNFLGASKSAQILLIRSLKGNSIPDFSSENFVKLIASCGAPMVINQKVFNSRVTNWALKVLITICDCRDQCCSYLCKLVASEIKICTLLEGKFSVETAYLTLKFLCNCVDVKELFVHGDTECVFLSMSKLLKQCFLSGVLKQQQIKFFVACVDLLCSCMCVHGVNSVYSLKCVCFAKILDEIFTWICAKEINDKWLLLKVFTFMQNLFKNLVQDSWHQLRSRMNDDYLITMNKICHSSGSEMNSVLEIVHELLEHEGISPVLKCDYTIPSSSKS